MFIVHCINLIRKAIKCKDYKLQKDLHPGMDSVKITFFRKLVHDFFETKLKRDCLKYIRRYVVFL